MRNAVVKSLGRFNKHKQQIIPVLIHTLADGRAEVRRSTVLALGRLGRKSPEASTALEKHAGDDDPIVRLNIKLVLGSSDRMDEAGTSLLLEAIACHDEDTSAFAADLMRSESLKNPQKVLPKLEAILENSRGSGTLNVLKVLRRMRESAEPALPKIALVYPKADPKGRIEVLRAVSAIDLKGDHAIPVIIQALADGDRAVRREALMSVHRYRNRGHLFVEPLSRELADGDAENRRIALSHLRGMGSNASAALPQIVRLADDPDLTVRTLAINTLGRFNPPKEDAIRTLSRTIADVNERVRRVTIAALKQLGMECPDMVIPILESALKKEKDASIRESIIATLEILGKRPEPTKKNS